MSLLEDIAAANAAQVAAIDDRLAEIKAAYDRERAGLKSLRSLLIGRRKRIDEERAIGQAELPFHTQSIEPATPQPPLDQARISEIMGSTMRPARGGFGPAGAQALADQHAESQAVSDHLAAVEREAEGEDMIDVPADAITLSEMARAAGVDTSPAGWDLPGRPLTPEEHEAARIVPAQAHRPAVDPPAPDVEPRLRRRKGADRG